MVLNCSFPGDKGSMRVLDKSSMPVYHTLAMNVVFRNNTLRRRARRLPRWGSEDG